MKTLAKGILVLSFSTGAALLLAGGAAADTDPIDAVGSKWNEPTLDANCTRVNACTSSRQLNGEAWAGGSLLWQTDFGGGLLELYDTSTCQFVSRCVVPGGVSPSELTVLGGLLYHYDFGTGLLYGINTTSCQTASICNPPGDDQAEGLTSDGTYLYKGDSQFIYKFLPGGAAGGGCQEVARCPNPAGDSADGLTFCNDQLIMLGYSGIVYRIDFNSCTITGTCQLNAGASGNGIASDRTNRLWADNINGDIDLVDVGCSIPIPVSRETWSSIKVFYR